MILYFLCIKIAALLGHKKARLLVQGQQETIEQMNRGELAAHQGCIWIHAASVGEFEQARPLIERLVAAHKKVVVTFFSPSGYEARKHFEQAAGVYYLPFATRSNAKKFIEALQPQMAIFVKYEFWPAYLKELKKHAIPTYSISAIFRPGQRFFRWYGWFSRQLLHCFTHIFVQDEASLALLNRIGANNCSVAGDTRFDRVWDIVQRQNAQPDARLTFVERFAADSERVIVAGSTWPADEELIAQYIEDKDCKLILVPHEIDEEHLHKIFNLFQGRYVRLSHATGTALVRAKILVVDTIGLLSRIYRFGQVAYIGGGFGEGIHNTLEAAVYGVPVIFGPKYHHFREAQGLINAGAARSIRNYQEMEEALDTALAQHAELGAKAAEYVQSELGATQTIYNDLFGNK